ncbi:MAG: 3-isopropylmalate dehydratase large subunit, partial [Acidobacteriia bacterium]|nr:3-isopropylmalate dehydratase large subunit [Terriglobia bacterium]
MAPRTLYEKIWDNHVVHDDPELPALIYIDRHIVHDISAQAFAGIAAANRKVRRPDLTLAVVDHAVPTTHRDLPIVDPHANVLLDTVARNCKQWGIRLFD